MNTMPASGILVVSPRTTAFGLVAMCMAVTPTARLRAAIGVRSGSGLSCLHVVELSIHPVSGQQLDRGVPCSTIRPWCMTRIFDTLRSVDSRWATMKVVRPTISRSSASRMTASVLESIDEVGSSRIRIGAFFEEGPGDRDALTLAAGQLRSALAEHRLVSLRQRRDEVVRVGRFGRRDNLVHRRVQAAVADVVGDASPRTAAAPAARC